MPSYTVKSGVLSSSTAYCYQRKLARASDGTLWCVYHRSDGTYYQIYVSYSTDGGETWVEEQVTKVASHQYWPSIAIDSKDNIHIVWHGAGWGSNPSYENIQYRKRTSVDWEKQEAITDKDSTQCFSSIAVDSNDNIHVVWSGLGWGSNPDYYNIQYRKRTSSGWQVQEAVTDKNESQTNVSIAIDSKDNIHVVWKGPGWGSNPDYYNIQYRMRTASGWEKQEAITDKDGHQVNPCIAIDSNDNVHVVWHGVGWGSNPRDDIQYRKRTSSGWQAQEGVTDADDGQYNPSIAIDSEDNVHVVWRGLGWGSNPNNYNIQHRKRTSSGWEKQEGLTDAHTNQYYPNLIWAFQPTVFGLKINRPRTGYAFVWVDETTLKFYKSNDFTASTLLHKEICWEVANLSNWQYKKRITIAGSSGAGTNYQVLLKVGESSGASGCDFHVEGHSAKFPDGINDGGDLRFTDSNEANLLDFWVEKVEGSSPNRVAYCWVKVTDDLESDVDIYCFYGNPSATSASDGEATFEFFEDFETWEGWTQYSGGQVSQSSARVYNGTYSAHKTTHDDPAGAYKPLPSSLGRNIALEVMVNRNSNFSGGSADRIGVIDDNGDGYGVGYQHDQDKIFLDVRTNYTGSVTWGSVNTDHMDDWYKLVLKIEPSDIRGEKWYQGTQEGTLSKTDTSYNTFTRFYIFGGHDYWVDLVRIRKYVSPEPVFSSAGDEEVNQFTSNLTTSWKLLSTYNLYSTWKLLNGKELGTQWKVFEELTKDTAWQILATETISRIIEWKLLVAQDVSPAWKLLNTSEANSQWKILDKFDLSSSWKLLTRSDETTTWKILNEFGKEIAWKLLLSKSKDISWQILILNIMSKLIAWKLITYFDVDATWKILDAVKRDTSWKLLVSKDRTTAWKLLTSLDTTSAWRLLSEVSRQSSWKLLTTKDRSLSWQILLLYILSRDLTWKLIATDDLSFKWRILTGAELDSSWKLFNWLDKDASWKILDKFTTGTVWKILNEKQKDLSWKLFEEEIKELAWSILSEIYSRDVAWKILKSEELDTKWLVGLLYRVSREILLDSQISKEIILESNLNVVVKK